MRFSLCLSIDHAIPSVIDRRLWDPPCFSPGPRRLGDRSRRRSVPLPMLHGLDGHCHADPILVPSPLAGNGVSLAHPPQGCSLKTPVRRGQHLGGKAMPGSASVFDDIVTAMIRLTAPRVALDIGPGMGKYGKIIKGIELETNCAIHKICVEVANEKIIKRFMLHELYDEILNEDAANLPKRYPMLTGDVVVAGDVMEHLTKSEGIDLIEYLQYRFKNIFLVIPVDWVEYSCEDYDYESHISIWRIKDIQNFGGGYCVERVIEPGHRFLLGSVNGITVPVADHFVVRDKIMNSQPKPLGTGIEFGFLHP